MKTTKAENVLKPHQINLIKKILALFTVSQSEESKHSEQFYMLKWFDFHIDWIVRVEIDTDGKHYKVVYFEFINPDNKFEITK